MVPPIAAPKRAALKGGPLSLEHHHYQLNYTPPDTERGRRLARR